jgi:hypothetical protein
MTRFLKRGGAHNGGTPEARGLDISSGLVMSPDHRVSAALVTIAEVLHNE